MLIITCPAEMPRYSYKQKVLRRARALYSRAKGLFVVEELLENENFDLASPSFLGVLRARSEVNKISESRYMKRDKDRKPRVNIFRLDLEVGDNQWQKDLEFLEKYRMSRENLDIITNRIAGCDAFTRGS